MSQIASQDRKDPQEKAAEEAQLAAWGAALPELYPEIAGERMVGQRFFFSSSTNQR